VSDIFKKVTSIDPVDEDTLDALKARGSDRAPRRSLLRPLPEDNPAADPVPEFITRESDIIAEKPAPALAPKNIIEEKIIETPQHIETARTTEIPLAPAAMAAPVPMAASISQDFAPSTAWMKWAGIAAVLIWLGASFAYMYGFFDLGRKWTDLSPIQIAGLVLAALQMTASLPKQLLCQKR